MAQQGGPTSWNIDGIEQHETIDLTIDADSIEAFRQDNFDIIQVIAHRFARYVENSDAVSLHLLSATLSRMIQLTKKQIGSQLIEQLRQEERKGKNLQ